MFLLFFCGKYRNYAEDADFSELCGSALPHPVRCHEKKTIGVTTHFSKIINLTILVKSFKIQSNVWRSFPN